jgi:hypothetical protein
MTRILFLFLIVILLNVNYVGADDASICRSEQWEQKIREISGTSIEIIAVCPKKDSFYVEVKGTRNELSIFKQMLRSSDMGVVSIQDWGETGTGATLLRVGVSK